MNKLTFMIASFIGMSAFAYSDTHKCTKSEAFQSSMLAIQEKYPFWKNSQPYRVIDRDDSYWLVLGSVPKGTLGGTPEAVVSKEDCEIESIYHSQ